MFHSYVSLPEGTHANLPWNMWNCAPKCSSYDTVRGASVFCNDPCNWTCSIRDWVIRFLFFKQLIYHIYIYIKNHMYGVYIYIQYIYIYMEVS